MNTAKAPLDDVNCRLALANAFDYDAGVKMVAITDTVSQGRASSGAVLVGMLGANPAENVIKRDLDAAKAHLAKCKYKPEDINLELSWIGEVPLEERFALLMQANFAEIGVKSEIKKLPWALFSEQVSKPENTPNISQLFVNAVTGDPDTLLYGMYHSSAAGTWQSPEYLKDAEVDAALDAGRTAPDDAKRTEAYSTLNKRLRGDCAVDLRLRPGGGVRREQARLGSGTLGHRKGIQRRRLRLQLPADGNERIADQRSGRRNPAGPPSSTERSRSTERKRIAKKMPPVVRLLAKRLGTSFIVLIGVSMLIFTIARVIPGDPARIALGPNATAEARSRRCATGCISTRPFVVQYGYFLARPVRAAISASRSTPTGR